MRYRPVTAPELKVGDVVMQPDGMHYRVASVDGADGPVGVFRKERISLQPFTGVFLVQELTTLEKCTRGQR